MRCAPLARPLTGLVALKTFTLGRIEQEPEQRKTGVVDGSRAPRSEAEGMGMTE